MGIDVIFFYILVILSITAHEYMHGFVAFKFGDTTAKDAGRLTLNPLKHIDVFGTIILPVILMIFFGKAFGYAKPVPVNPYNFKNPQKNMAIVALAGPGINFIIFLVFGLIARFVGWPWLRDIFLGIALLNGILALFNLMPIPPLDGSRIMAALLPYKSAYKYLRLEPYGFFILLGLIFTGFFKDTLILAEKFLLMILGFKIV